MKRSEINAIMHRADDFLRQQNFHLPPFAYWTPEDWRHKGPEAREIVQNKLGWDITDFGKGDFLHLGLFLFTIRNGNPENWKSHLFIRDYASSDCQEPLRRQPASRRSHVDRLKEPWRRKFQETEVWVPNSEKLSHNN